MVTTPVQFVADTSYGPAQVSRAAGWSVGVIDSATIASSAAPTLSELLSARVAGVSVLRSSGVVGAGSRVQLRGASSFFGAREPIVVIDGVRIDAAQNAHSLGTDAQAPSRLDDIDLRDIQRIEILRGPAASALYGTDGAGGVLRITTLRPRRGRFSWSAFGEGNTALTATDYPANHSTGSGVGLGESCTRGEAALASCTPGPLLGWNPLESATPFRTTGSGALGARVMGGVGRIGYLASASTRDEAGVLVPNASRRSAARIVLDADPLSTLRLTLDGAYWHSRVTLPLIDGQMPAVLLAGLEGNAVDDPVYRGYNASDLPVPLDTPTEERVGRAVGAVSATWTPVQWLTARARVGGESLRGDDRRSTGVGGDSTRSEGSVQQRTSDRNSSTSLDANVSAAFHVTRSLRTETTLGGEHLHRATYASDSSGIGSVFDYSQRWTHSDITGLYASQRLAWHQRRYVGMGVRRDQWAHDAFAASTFFSADGTWVIGDEAFFPRSSWLSGLRLRGAYGRTTDVRTYALAPPAFVPPAPGSTAPGAPSGETISELEAGIDAFLFQRLWLETTWFRQRSGNALATCCLTGPALIGDWRTTGIDATLSASLVRSLGADWTARLDVSAFSNRIHDAGLGRPSVAAGNTPVPLVRIRNGAGHPIGGVWGNPVHSRDENVDGIISDPEVTVDNNAVYLGSSIPTREIDLSSTFALRRVSFSALVDYRGGFAQVNGTEAYRCELELCGALYDPEASLDDQARAAAVFRAGAGFVEDASFVRLREIAVTWKLLPGWTYRRGLAAFDLTIAARNLLTFTGYSGLDPETNYMGRSGLSRGDFFALPVPRTFVARLKIQR